MKNIFTYIVLFIFSCNAGFAQIQKEQLVGTWIFDYPISVANMDAGAKKVYEKNQRLQVGLESSFKNRQLTFDSRGNYLLRLASGKQVPGTWNVNAINGSKLLMSSSKHTENLTVVMLSATSLVLKPINNGKAKPILGTWYFTKVQ
ncbi:hypothetical protein [Flavobacterium sp. GSA192]|uniref:hypothetical protein n=1 Tax=Flavobacterium sp. GSA192 TaxID=2576304 RepID=UPI00112E4FFC|nr:hypothetical protein [Flavobacterium sp. GSA192]